MFKSLHISLKSFSLQTDKSESLNPASRKVGEIAAKSCLEKNR